MGIQPNVFWFFVAATAAFIVVHAILLAVTNPRGKQAH